MNNFPDLINNRWPNVCMPNFCVLSYVLTRDPALSIAVNSVTTPFTGGNHKNFNCINWLKHPGQFQMNNGANMGIMVFKENCDQIYTSNLPTLVIHNFRLEKPTFSQQ